jgi:glycosyltransferase involved in cell wall biosynthesis
MARICVIREGYYPLDTRVSREVEVLVRSGHTVDVICLPRPGQPRFERLAGVTVYRIPIVRNRSGMLRYLLEAALFQVAATLLAGALHVRHRYDLVQVNSLPDWLVFAGIVPRLLGARVLLDLHECMPEYFVTRYRRSMRDPAVRAVMFLEQMSIRFANAVMTCTQQMRERFVERGADAAKIGVVLNSYDEDRFDPRRFPPPPSRSDGFLLVCHGTIDENFGIDLVVRAVALLRDRVPGLRLKIYGDGTHRLALEALAAELGVQDRVWFSRGFLQPAELMPLVAQADAGVVAVRRDAFRDLTHSNKMYDFIALRKPVIISRTRAVEAYFGEGCFEMFESGNERDLARAIHEVYADANLRDELVRRATEVSEPYRWRHQKQRYLDTVERLVSGGDARGSRPALVTESGDER